MSKSVYMLQKVDDFTFDLMKDGKREEQLWRTGDIFRCTGCSGPLVAMLTSCKHARKAKIIWIASGRKVKSNG